MSRRSEITRRWRDVLELGVTAGLIWGLIDRISRPAVLYTSEAVASFTRSYPIWSAVYIVVFGVFLVRAIHQISGARTSHFRYLFAYPPSVLAVIPAFGILVAMQLSGVLHSSLDSASWILVLIIVLLALVIAFLAECPAHSLITSTFVQLGFKRTASSLHSGERVASLEEWFSVEVPIARVEDDKFNHIFIANRIARVIQSDSRKTIGIVGDFGSGKSGVVNMAREIVSSQSRNIWFSDVDCWGFENSAAIVERILEDVVHRIGEKVDCGNMRTLPSRYLKAISVAHPSLAAAESILGEQVGPERVIAQLDSVLEACDSRVVVVIQDMDRNSKAQFDTAAVSTTDRFRHTCRVSFILASGASSTADLTRLCDHIEPMPGLAA